MATSGTIVSGSAVPTAARTLPTTPSDRPNPSPIHSTPLVKSSAPPRITSSEKPSRTHSIGRASCHTAARRHPEGGLLPSCAKGSSPQADPVVMTAARRGPADPSPPARTRPSAERKAVGRERSTSPIIVAPDGRPPAGRSLTSVLLAIGITLPAIALRIGGGSLGHGFDALAFGLAIVGAAFILSWAAEVALLVISAGLAIAVLALIAVLPEYAVDFVFAWQGGNAFESTGPACLPSGGGTESPC